MDFHLEKRKKKKACREAFWPCCKPYSLTLGLTLMPEACPKALASPTLYSLPQFRLWAAFQPHYAVGFPQLEDATGTGSTSVGQGMQWSQHAPPGTARGQDHPCRWARLPEGSGDAEGACSFPGGPSGSQSCRAPGRRQQLGHDCVWLQLGLGVTWRELC